VVAQNRGQTDHPAAPAAQAGAPGTVDQAGTPNRRRFSYLRHYARSLSYAGLTCGWLFFILSLTPSLMPRSWQAQGIVSGSALAEGYGLGVVVSWTGRRIGVPRPSARMRRRAWYAFAVAAFVTVPLIVYLTSLWERRVREAMGVDGTAALLYLGVFAVAVALAAAAVAVARLIHDIYLALAGRLLRILPRFAARLLATVLVVALVVGFATGFAEQVLLRLADTTFSSADHGNLPGVTRPLSPLRSGGPSSLVAWNSLGMQGRAFVSGGPTAADIERLTGRAAVEPIRVYAGLASAATLQGEANLVLRELIRMGAFRRALLAVATPTGRGSVYPSLADPLEYMYGGNTAIAGIQYSYLPSWISFLAQRPQARQAGRALFNTIYAHWSRLDPKHRPRLVVFGESLGAFGAEAAFSGLADMTTRTSGALLVGPPNSTEVWRELTNARTKGSPEWLPTYGNGRTVRFAASASDLRQPGGALRHPKVVYLQHASDPVVWWSPGLIWHKPDWLAEPRGPDVTSQMQWYPFVTFWQITADLIVRNTTPGYGHHYSTEIPTAWAAILHPPRWHNSDTRKLTAMAAAADALPWNVVLNAGD
jgi:uncharacterized membrane protein